MNLIYFFLFFLIGFFIAHFKIHLNFFMFLKYKIIFKILNFFDNKKLRLIDLKKKINLNSEYKALQLFIKKKYKDKGKLTKKIVFQSINKDQDFQNSKIKKNYLIAKFDLKKNFILKIHKSKLQNNFCFKWIEFYKKNTEIKKNLIFLHGNTCDPGEIFGLKRGYKKYSYQKFSDPIAFSFANRNMRVILPIKFNFYLKNLFNEASLDLHNVGLNINYIEQMKIFSLFNNFKKKISIFGFSQGAWQALVSSQFLKFDEMIFYDFLVDPKKFNLKKGHYKDFKFGYKTILNYIQSFKNSRSKQITILIGKKSPLYDKKFINSTISNINKKKLNVIYYNDTHYISSLTVEKYLLNEKK